MHRGLSTWRIGKLLKMCLNKLLINRLHGIHLITLLCYVSFSCSDSTKIACAGDSITYGYGLKNPENESYPSILNKKLGNAFKVKNFGHSGATALKNSDLPYWNVSEFRKLKKYQPDIIILLLGSNDAKNYNWPGHEKFRMNYKSLVLEFISLKSKPKIYLGIPPPIFGETDIINNDIIVQEIIPVIKETAISLNVQVINFHEAFRDKPHLFPDNIHPGKEAAKAMAEIVLREITDE